MPPLAIGLWVGGLALLALGALRIRAPLARVRSLDETDANLRRYDEWRGSRLRPDAAERTGADALREELRRQSLTWGVAIAAGIVLIGLGFVVR